MEANFIRGSVSEIESAIISSKICKILFWLYTEKVSLNKLGVDGILNYITDPNIAKNTRSDRQMHLVEALAVSMGAREAINLLENDTEFKQQFAEQQQKDQQNKDFKNALLTSL